MTEIILHLKPNKSSLGASRHPWVFDGALDISGEPKLDPGIARLYTAKDQFAAVGTYNPKSPIAFRVLSKRDEPIDAAFFHRRFKAAKQLRSATVEGDTDGFRWINSEGDRLPGLTVDAFAGHLVIQVGTPAMDALTPMWMEALRLVFEPFSVIRKDSQSVANREHMTAVQTVIEGAPPDRVSFKEAGIPFRASVLPGQKTGFFFDQRENRIRTAVLCKNKRVLDGYAYTGGFGAHALSTGAASVIGVDSSAPACEMMRTNYGLNAANDRRFDVVKDDCVQYLKQTTQNFDVVVLDPPALAKRRHHLPQAGRLYREIFEGGIRRIEPDGGFLSASSCSAAVDTKTLIDILKQAAQAANRNAQVLHIGSAGADHPVCLDHPEGEYLKSVLLRIEPV